MSMTDLAVAEEPEQTQEAVKLAMEGLLALGAGPVKLSEAVKRVQDDTGVDAGAVRAALSHLLYSGRIRLTTDRRLTSAA